jgi:hypothetical protein
VGAQPTVWLLIPAGATAAALLLRARAAAAWSGAVLWVLVLFHAHAEAMLGPMIMLVACVAIAVGPERFGSIVARDWYGQPPRRPDPTAWIEDDRAEEQAGMR